MPNGIFSSFDVSASGLSAQRRRLDVIAENLANVETTRTPEGGPYRRKRAVLGSETSAANNTTSTKKNFLELVRNNVKHMNNSEMRREVPGPESTRVQLSVTEDDKPFRMEYDPGHPDADERGYVLKPNVNMVEEMVDMILATRAYQANAVALDAAKDMFIVSLEI
jgi:flagellar basal-body rod protein FlgC